MTVTVVPYIRTPFRDAAGYASIQAAIDDLPSTGGQVVIPAGTTTLTSGISTTKGNLELYGSGGSGQDATLGIGATIIEVPSGQVGLTVGDGSSTIFRGPVIGGIHFKGVSGATGGLWLRRVNNWRLEGVVASGFTTGYGFYSDGTGDVNQYGSLWHCGAHNCKYGLDIKLSNGIEDHAGYYDGNSNGSGSGVIASGSGIRVQSGDTFRGFGTRVQFYETAFNLAGGSDHELHGCRVEAGFTTGISIVADYVSVFGGSINNNIGGGTGTGVLIDAAATDTLLAIPKIQSVSTTITDNGTNTVYLHDRRLQFPTSGEIKWGTDLVLTRKSAGNLLVNNNLYVNSNLVVDDANGSAKALFGSAQDTNLYRSAANVLKTDDQFYAVGSITTSTKAGIPTDSDTTLDQDGTMIVDTTNSRLYVRCAGSWKYATLT